LFAKIEILRTVEDFTELMRLFPEKEKDPDDDDRNDNEYDYSDDDGPYCPACDSHPSQCSDPLTTSPLYR
jgi:lysyl-tRNA synthetase class I